MTKVLAKIV